MKFSCDQCNAQYMIADEKVGARGVKVKCKKCSHIIIVKPLTEAAPAAAAPAASDAGGAGFGAVQSQPAFSAPAPAPVAAPPGGDAWGSFGAPSPSTSASASGGEWGLDAAFGAPAAAPAPALAPAAAASRPAGEKEWYVAIEDSQVGPIDIAEIQDRWDKREVDEDTLAWKAGMGDWSPIAEVPELAYLVTERPQEKAKPSAPAFGGASFGAAPQMAGAQSAARAGVAPSSGPVAFGGGGEEAVSWTPSAASALSSLVQEELTATKPEPARPAGPSPSDLGMPSFGANDLFGGGGGGGNGGTGPAVPAMPVVTPSFAPPADPFAGSSQSWAAPKPTRSSNKGLIIALGAVAGVLVLGIVAALVVVLLRQQPVAVAAAQPAGSAPVPAVGAQPTSGPSAVPGAAGAGGGAVAPPSSNSNAGGSAQASADDGGHSRSSKEKGSKAGSKAAGAKAGGSSAGGGGGGGKDGLDDLVSEKPSKDKLTPDDVKAGVKTNMANLLECLKAARAKGELSPGQHTLVLDWQIQPNGSVTNGQLKGPPNVLGTSLPACFAAKMRTWKFPSSKAATPIRNFPFGPFNMK